MRADGITFVIPNWNHELVLARAVESALRAGAVLARHDLKAETIVVDDASRDGSVVLLRQLEALYADRGLRALGLPENRGPCGARAAAVGAAGYRYVVWMDADNEVIAENVPLFYRAIRDTGAAVVYGNLMRDEIDAHGLCSHESFRPAMFAGNYIDTFALCDAEQLRDAGGFWDDPRNTLEDWELWQHLAACGRKLVHVPVAFGYYYRCHLSRVQEACQDVKAFQLLQRAYRQFPAARDTFPLNTKHLRYHPDVGWL